MIFLFNDVLLDIEQPIEVIQSPDFPVSAQTFSRMQVSEIIKLACEEVFQDLQLPRTQPDVARQLAVLLAAKTGANAVLVGAPAEGARAPSDMGIRFAEVSLMTISHLYQLQKGGTLLPQHVQQAVWQSLPTD